VARKHFQAMSIARWGEGCRCHYTIPKATKSLHEGDDGVGGGSTDDFVRSNVEKVGGDNSSSSGGGDRNCSKKEDPDWLAFHIVVGGSTRRCGGVVASRSFSRAACPRLLRK